MPVQAYKEFACVQKYKEFAHLPSTSWVCQCKPALAARASVVDLRRPLIAGHDGDYSEKEGGGMQGTGIKIWCKNMKKISVE